MGAPHGNERAARRCARRASRAAPSAVLVPRLRRAVREHRCPKTLALARFRHWMYVQRPMQPIPSPVQAIIELFAGPLSELSFADVDKARFSELAAQVEASAAEVAAQEAALAAQRQVLAERQEALLNLAQRGLAYARVYAEGDAELTQQLAAIALPRPAKRVKAEGKAEGTSNSAARTPRADALAEEPSAPAASKGRESADPLANAAPAELPRREITLDEDTDDSPAVAPPARRGKRRDAVRAKGRAEHTLEDAS